MQMQRIEEFRVGDIATGFFLVRAVEIKNKKNGDPYIDLELGDATGSIRSKKWDILANERAFAAALAPGDIVKAQGKVTEYNGNKQYTIDKLRAAADSDDIERSSLFKTAPEKSEEMYQYIMDTIHSFRDEDLRKLCLSFYEDNREKLMYYPAASKNHHAEYGGLLYHVKRMMMMGEHYCEVYTLLDRDLLLAGVALHDIEKLNEILSDTNGVSPGYSAEGQLLGHLVMGAMVIHQKCIELNIDSEKAMVLEHMVLSHHMEPEFGSPKKPMIPEAEALHYLDMVDAKMFDYENALGAVDEGGFSERIFTLDHKIYKRKF